MSDRFEFANAKVAVILGSNKGIGLAFAKELSQNYPTLKIYGVHRIGSSSIELSEIERVETVEMDIFDENQVKSFISGLESVDLFINTVGFLHDNEIQPEKSLRDFSLESSLEVFKVNSLLTPVWAKYLKGILSKSDPSLFLCLSAKVGSIEDNRIGGWYSYRASKAALNMMLKNISIEFERYKLKTFVVAVHPGTTITDLSKPFISQTKYKLWQPIETARNIIAAFQSQKTQESGIFLDWKGGHLPW